MKKKIGESKSIKKMKDGGPDPVSSVKNAADNTYVKKPIVGAKTGIMAKRKAEFDKKYGSTFGEKFMYGFKIGNIKEALGLNKKKMGGSVKSKKK